MPTKSLDRLLTTLVVHLHSTSVCVIGEGWRLTFQPMEALIVHHVLAGSGVVRVGNGVALPYAPGGIIVVPPGQPHAVGDGGPAAREVPAGDHCGPFADGLVSFATGPGPGTLLVCGSVPAPYGQALGLFDLLLEPSVKTPASNTVRHAFSLMQEEVASPSLGTAAMTEALMKTCLVALLREHLQRDHSAASSALPTDPRLVRVVLAVLENPGAPHTVAGLAELAGMSRASFADHFARALKRGPMEFVQGVRLRAAARLLDTTDMPLKVIAAAVGYAGPAPFSRAFRGAYGTDPMGYRNLAGDPEASPAPLRRDADPDSY